MGMRGRSLLVAAALCACVGVAIPPDDLTLALRDPNGHGATRRETPQIVRGGAWTAESDHTGHLNTRGRTWRNFAAKELEGVGPMCAITAGGTSITCWFSGGMSSDALDRTFSLDLPPCLPATRFMSVRVHQDVWALTNSGHLVVFLQKGAYATNGWAGWPRWPVNESASYLTAPLNMSWSTVGVYPGPWTDFWVLPDAAARPSAGQQQGLQGAPQDWRREVCALDMAGELTCWILMHGQGEDCTVPFSRVFDGDGSLIAPVSMPTQSSCGWCDMSTVLYTHAAMRHVLCDAEGSSVCQSVGQGPFDGMQFSKVTYDGAFRFPDSWGRVFGGRNGNLGQYASGRQRWMGAYFYRWHDMRTLAASVQTYVVGQCDRDTRLRSQMVVVSAPGELFVPVLAGLRMGGDGNLDAWMTSAVINANSTLDRWYSQARPPDGGDCNRNTARDHFARGGFLVDRYSSVAGGYHGVGCYIVSGLTESSWTPRDSSRNWQFVASSSDGTKLVAVASVGQSVTGPGQIYTSTDSGVSWTARDSDRNWISVASSSDGTKLVAVVWNGQIYTSTDSGMIWTARDGIRDWQSVASSSDGTKLVAVVYREQIYTSADSGVTWTVRDISRAWESVASSSDGTKLVAVGGQIFTSTNSGVSWTARATDIQSAWRSVASSSDGTKLVAVVNGGQIYTSTDSGESWTARDSNRDWRSVASSSDGTKLVAVVYGGLVYTYG